MTRPWTPATAEAAALPAPLELPSPLDLPAEIALPPDAAARMRARLGEALAALADPDPAARLDRLTALRAELGEGGAPTAPARRTAIPAGPEDVEDFDRYFRVRRIESEAPAEEMLRGLVHVAAAVSSLALRGPDLPPEALAAQVAGFAAHARALGRVCGLETLP
ncbi:hypothetical protein [Albimonas pacifica]|uniref:Uncharacterized protein n=1 Tax=Albimonas pacifica TaxID=1114924 RepID=A0A1I3DAW1_9RHOB|nr:hypothetical protein [Albimonas pacifica]SFH83843.1 hypothetical protein SAMN05216258_102483 [Albimonas pacifica]